MPLRNAGSPIRKEKVYVDLVSYYVFKFLSTLGTHQEEEKENNINLRNNSIFIFNPVILIKQRYYNCHRSYFTYTKLIYYFLDTVSLKKKKERKKSVLLTSKKTTLGYFNVYTENLRSIHSPLVVPLN